MARGGKDINPSLFSDKLTKEIDKTIRDIVIIQYSQVTGKCPSGHKYCLNRECWTMEENDE